MKSAVLFKSKKSLVLVFLSIILITAISVGGTVAYFSGKDEIKNTLTIGRIDITLDEPKWDPDDGKNIKPGKTMEKDPTVTAVSGDSYMRIRMEITDGEGQLITDVNRINLIMKTLWYDNSPESLDVNAKYSEIELSELAAEKKLIAEYNTDDFAFAGIESGKPGVRYYNYIANEGIFSAENKDTATLFTNVIIPISWHNTEIFILNGDTYQETPSGSVEVIQNGTGYKIVMVAEAIQSDETVSRKAACFELDSLTGITRDLTDAAD